MKIVQAIETGGPGGAEQVLIRSCLGLRRRGHEVEVVLRKPGWLADRIRDAGIPLTTIPLRGALDHRFARRLRAHLERCGADVLHTHEFTFGIYGAWACRGGGTRHVATAHGKNFAGSFKRRLACRLALRRDSTVLVAVSADLAADLTAALGLPSGRVPVIANGVPSPDTSAPPPRAPGTPLRMLAIGNLYPVKNHGLLIDAVAGLRATGVDVELDVLGRGKEEGALREAIERHGLSGRVRLQGFRDDVESFLARCHVLVSSSLSEGMPVSFLEAMTRGLPVVASRVGGVPEIVEHGRHGLLYPSGDAAALADAVTVLERDDARRVEMGRAASVFVQEHYSDDRMIERYLELYRA